MDQLVVQVFKMQNMLLLLWHSFRFDVVLVYVALKVDNMVEDKVNFDVIC